MGWPPSKRFGRRATNTPPTTLRQRWLLRPTSYADSRRLLEGSLGDFGGFAPKQVGVSIYTKARGESICECLASGLTMAQAAKKIGVPDSIIYKWASKNPEFSDALIRARSHQAHCLMDRALDQLETHISAGDAKNGRQAVEAYIKIAEKLAPSKYGTRYIQHSGEIENKMSEEERNLRILEILAKTSPELFNEHVPQIIDVSAEPTRLLENFEPKAGERASPEVEAITDCNWEVA